MPPRHEISRASVTRQFRTLPSTMTNCPTSSRSGVTCDLRQLGACEGQKSIAIGEGGRAIKPIGWAAAPRSPRPPTGKPRRHHALVYRYRPFHVAARDPGRLFTSRRFSDIKFDRAIHLVQFHDTVPD